MPVLVGKRGIMTYYCFAITDNIQDPIPVRQGKPGDGIPNIVIGDALCMGERLHHYLPDGTATGALLTLEAAGSVLVQAPLFCIMVFPIHSTMN
jgi:hypothetical protein